QAGIAGVFKETGLNIGDVAIATREHYIHTGVQTNSIKNAPLPFDLIKADPLSREGIYLFEQDRVDHANAILSQALATHKINITKGPFITVSSITSSLEQANRLYSTFFPVMEAMEGAACAHIAKLYDIPVIEIRSASNFVGERDKSKWDIGLAVKHLGLACTCHPFFK
ncbi:MAG: futalosine hydrolase, partial [Desulfobacterales bacterium]|nr:futalosine hydrolase [Desulfobacterales bacterium]